MKTVQRKHLVEILENTFPGALLFGQRCGLDDESLPQ